MVDTGKGFLVYVYAWKENIKQQQKTNKNENRKSL